MSSFDIRSLLLGADPTHLAIRILVITALIVLFLQASCHLKKKGLCAFQNKSHKEEVNNNNINAAKLTKIIGNYDEDGPQRWVKPEIITSIREESPTKVTSRSGSPPSITHHVSTPSTTASSISLNDQIINITSPTMAQIKEQGDGNRNNWTKSADRLRGWWKMRLGAEGSAGIDLGSSSSGCGSSSDPDLEESRQGKKGTKGSSSEKSMSDGFDDDMWTIVDDAAQDGQPKTSQGGTEKTVEIPRRTPTAWWSNWRTRASNESKSGEVGEESVPQPTAPGDCRAGEHDISLMVREDEYSLSDTSLMVKDAALKLQREIDAAENSNRV